MHLLTKIFLSLSFNFILLDLFTIPSFIHTFIGMSFCSVIHSFHPILHSSLLSYVILQCHSLTRSLIPSSIISFDRSLTGSLFLLCSFLLYFSCSFPPLLYVLFFTHCAHSFHSLDGPFIGWLNPLWVRSIASSFIHSFFPKCDSAFLRVFHPEGFRPFLERHQYAETFEHSHCGGKKPVNMNKASYWGSCLRFTMSVFQTSPLHYSSSLIQVLFSH